jgi:voltage-gated potassium channel
VSTRLHTRSSLRRIGISALLIVMTIVIGTVGYWLIEGWGLLDSLYMTMITITTIGYGEPRPLSNGGRVFTLVLIFSTIGIIGYALSTVTAFIVEGEFNRIVKGRQMDRRISQMEDHIVLCGCGSTGFYIAEELYNTQTPFVVIERDESRIEYLFDNLAEIPYVRDDATKDDALKQAGIDRAKGLVSAVSDDKDNVFIVLTARSMRPEMRIVARLINEENQEKLIRAGADEVVSPNAIGGQRMASVMVRPSVIKVLDEITHGPTPLGFAELPVDNYPGLVGKTLEEAHIAKETGMLVVAIHGEDGETRFNPGGGTRLHEGDMLLVLGTPKQRTRLDEINFS